MRDLVDDVRTNIIRKQSVVNTDSTQHPNIHTLTFRKTRTATLKKRGELEPELI